MIRGIRADRRRASDLLAQLASLEPQDAYDRMMQVGLSGAPMNAQLALDLHRRQISLHAGDLATTGRRQTIGVVFFAAGILVGLLANILSL